MMRNDGLSSGGPVIGSMLSAQSQQVASGVVASHALSSAKQLLAEHPTEPFPFEDLPKGRADPLWDEIRVQYKLSLLQLSALKNAVCINTPAISYEFTSTTPTLTVTR
jgi:hypothetical protein